MEMMKSLAKRDTMRVRTTTHISDWTRLAPKYQFFSFQYLIYQHINLLKNVSSPRFILTGFRLLWRLLLLRDGRLQPGWAGLRYNRSPTSHVSFHAVRIETKLMFLRCNITIRVYFVAFDYLINCDFGFSHERWDISGPEVEPYFFLPSFNDTGVVGYYHYLHFILLSFSFH